MNIIKSGTVIEATIEHQKCSSVITSTGGKERTELRTPNSDAKKNRLGFRMISFDLSICVPMLVLPGAIGLNE